MTDISDLEQRLTGALDRLRAAWQTASAEARSARLEAQAARRDNDALTAALNEAQSQLENAVAAAAAPAGSGEDTQAALADAATARAEAAAMLDALEAEKEIVATLSDQLDAARQAASDAQAQVQTLQAKVAVSDGAALGANLGKSAETEDTLNRLTDMEARIDQLTTVNSQLRKNNAALRNAHAAAVPDADLINAGLQAEIDALQALRAADRTEIDSVLAALKPLLEEQPNA